MLSLPASVAEPDPAPRPAAQAAVGQASVQAAAPPAGPQTLGPHLAESPSAAPPPTAPPSEEGALGAEPLEALPMGFWGDEDAPPLDAPAGGAADAPPANHPLGEARAASGAAEAQAGTLLEHPRFAVLQSLFPGRVLSYHADSPAEREADESGLTDVEAAGAIDFEESDDEGES